MYLFSILSYPGYILFLSVRKWSDEGLEKDKGTGPLCGGPERRFSFRDWRSWRCGSWEWQDGIKGQIIRTGSRVF